MVNRQGEEKRVHRRKAEGRGNGAYVGHYQIELEKLEHHDHDGGGNQQPKEDSESVLHRTRPVEQGQTGKGVDYPENRGKRTGLAFVCHVCFFGIGGEPVCVPHFLRNVEEEEHADAELGDWAKLQFFLFLLELVDVLVGLWGAEEEEG